MSHEINPGEVELTSPAVTEQTQRDAIVAHFLAHGHGPRVGHPRLLRADPARRSGRRELRRVGAPGSIVGVGWDIHRAMTSRWATSSLLFVISLGWGWPAAAEYSSAPNESLKLIGVGPDGNKVVLHSTSTYWSEGESEGEYGEPAEPTAEHHVVRIYIYDLVRQRLSTEPIADVLLGAKDGAGAGKKRGQAWTKLERRLKKEGYHLAPGTKPIPLLPGDHGDLVRAAYRIPALKGQIWVVTVPSDDTVDLVLTDGKKVVTWHGDFFYDDFGGASAPADRRIDAFFIDPNGRWLVAVGPDPYRTRGFLISEMRDRLKKPKGFEAGELKAGKLHSAFTWRAANNQPSVLGTYVAGRLTGKVVWLNGQHKTAEGDFVNGELEGRLTSFSDGKKREEGGMSAGKKKGEWTEYYPSGQAKRTQSFVGGERHGKTAAWDLKGSLSSTGAYVKGKKEGLFTNFSKGTKTKETTYLADRREGPEINYYPDRKKSYEGNWVAMNTRRSPYLVLRRWGCKNPGRV